MTNDEAVKSLLNVVGTVVQLIDREMAALPEGTEPALGDGTFLAMLIKLLEMLLPLILKFFPIPT